MNRRKVFNIHEDWLPIVLLLFSVLFFLHKGLSLSPVTGVLSSQSEDTRSIFYFLRSFGFETLRQGIIPLWNPYIFSGTPFIATLQTAIFYPLNLPFLFLPVSTAINWSIAFHLFLSEIFTYYLLKYYGIGRLGSIVAGIVYTFSAPQIMHVYAGHLNVLTAMVWTPPGFLFLDRFIREENWRYGIFLSLTITFQFLSGQPQYLFYSMIALSLYLLFLLIGSRIDGNRWVKIGKKGIMFFTAIFFSLALSAAQMFPTVEMIKYSTRETLSYEWISMFSFPPENLITFLIPDFFGDMQKLHYWGKNYLWEMSVYAGIMPILLTTAALFFFRNRAIWFFTGTAVISIIFAMGKYTPLLKFLYNYIPIFHLFRGNSKFIFLNALSIAVLSGFGADAVSKRLYMERQFRIVFTGFFILIIVSMFVMYAVFDDTWFREAINRAVYSGDFFGGAEPVMQSGFEVTAAAFFRKSVAWTMLLFILCFTILLLHSYKKLKGKTFSVIIIAITILDLFAFGMRYMATFDSREVYWDEDVVKFLKKDIQPFRVIAPSMDANSGMASRIETLGGYEPMMLKRYSEFINFSQGYSQDKPDLYLSINSINRLTDLLNAKYLVLKSGDKVNHPSFKPVFNNGRFSIFKNLNAMPRSFIVHKYKVIGDRDSVFKEMMSPEFNPADSVILEEDIENIFVKSADISPSPIFMDYSPNHIKIEAISNTPCLLILGDSYYPGWRAFIDGNETKIYRANYVMRAVVLTKGRHTVEFIYTPLSFKIAVIISLITISFITGFFVWRWKGKSYTEGNK
ncbi:MAG: YfhO family protein [Nitrospinae bacterium]|nr:YfhO family protein [Nitrospinota bacterium]